MSAYRKNITLQLGLITIPVDLHSAIENEVSLKTLCTNDHDPRAVTTLTKCPECGNDDKATFVKGKADGKEFVVVTAEEVAEAKSAAVGETKKHIALTAHPAEQVATKTLQGKESSYYCTPATEAMKPFYGLLVEMIRRHPEVTLCGLFTPASRPGLYALGLYGDTIMLTPRARTEAVKVQAQPVIEIEEATASMADQLLMAGVSDFDPATYTDQYQENLAALVAARHGVEVPTGKTVKAAPAAMDLTSLLEAALASVGVAA